jgi:hypothetical protein
MKYAVIAVFGAVAVALMLSLISPYSVFADGL